MAGRSILLYPGDRVPDVQKSGNVSIDDSLIHIG